MAAFGVLNFPNRLVGIVRLGVKGGVQCTQSLRFKIETLH
jgi:hypothetical protein